jgi:ABC-type transport system substrate-binding protein
VVVIAGCGTSSSNHASSPSTSTASHKGGTLTILANSSFGVADPAQNYTLEEWQLLINTHDGLTAFQHVGGLAGTKIVPDLASSIPLPTNGGKTYVFNIRRGIKFSNGATLAPTDFLRTFERQFTVPGPTAFYSDFVGANKCSTKGCNLSKGVVANDSNYTLTINLTAPDPEIMDQLALPFADAVPATTSLKLTGNNVPPGTGPYMWKTYNPNTEAVLVRNPYFHVWSAAAQPAGNPNEIVEKYGLPVSDEVTEVENGEADEVWDGDQIPSDQLSQLNSPTYSSQVHVNTLTADWYFALNTRKAPFNNLMARQAINYAANRSAYVKIAGGPSLAVPACQILPLHHGVPDGLERAECGQGQAAGEGIGHARRQGRGRRHQRRGWQGAGRADGVGPRLHRLQGQSPAAHHEHPVPVCAELVELEPLERRLVGVVPGLPGPVGLPERPAGLQQHSREQRCKPEHRGVLRPGHSEADHPGRVGGGGQPGCGHKPVDAD